MGGGWKEGVRGRGWGCRRDLGFCHKPGKDCERDRCFERMNLAAVKRKWGEQDAMGCVCQGSWKESAAGLAGGGRCR